MTAVEVYRHRPAPGRDWWPSGNPAGTLAVADHAADRRPGLKVNGANPVHAYYPQVIAEFGVRIVVAATWTYRLELKP